MLPPANRMRAAADFTTTTRRGRKVTRGTVVVYLDVDPDDTRTPLAGLIVGKAVGGSVARHRAARRIRAALAPVLHDLPRGGRVVVRALKGSDTDPQLADSVRAAIASARARSST